ncbi:multidrug ABC transporter ATP-binding protein [Neokomagataea thailandica NBRC 106555]|uniref:ABC transporter ATP-binding protein n=2 Tax=Neokomagataea TaxID=1223423 RepID=A0A4Y6V815_9PROT|nr:MULTISPECIES: ABC transporter ATP-binding protein [Neokomagataea]QDH25484.1 ABC transporter ATP-binding protein [Neokomagataea tanensis]GBR54837.1 multidrug ABC transporter ATP-binding protein [Neokomagataea thailandica NBRC 106555]
MTNLCVEARDVTRCYKGGRGIKGINLAIPMGRIVGLVGANGSGKTTLLRAITGLTGAEGDLRVNGLNPWTQRGQMMEDITFIADTAILPRWMNAAQILDYVQGVHPRFDRTKAERFLAGTTVSRKMKVRQMSKGMVVQLHLAVVLAIDARLLVLDEPTLGLDLVFRTTFYRTLLEEFASEERTIIISTHQVEEIEHILTDVVVLSEGRIVFQEALDALEERFFELRAKPEREEEVMRLGPVAEWRSLGQGHFLFDLAKPAGVTAEMIGLLGEVRSPRLADVLVRLMEAARPETAGVGEWGHTVKENKQ